MIRNRKDLYAMYVSSPCPSLLPIPSQQLIAIFNAGNAVYASDEHTNSNYKSENSS
uniref:Uncharacterized protein n=1 Tax=viral metagenome TaxID=1070528 RepID=A0A6C0KSF6_9ZZZZ